MSRSYWITPIDADAKKRLKSAKVKLPRQLPPSRGPTPAELRTILGTFGDFTAQYNPAKPKRGADWQILVRSRKKPMSGPGLLISLSELESTDKPLPLIFIEVGAPEVVALLAVECFKVCGLQLLDGEDVYGPHLVDGKRTPAELVAAMEAHAAKAFGEFAEEFEG